MSQLLPFQFHGKEIRVLVFDDGHEEWVARDVCEVLGLVKVDRALARLKAEEKGTHPMSTLGGVQPMSTVTESGLYRLIFRSDKPEAKQFQAWVFEEVLPTIRKTGSYQVTPKASEAYPELKALAAMIEGLAEARLRIEATERQAHIAEQKADLALAGQQWLTLREYVYLHRLERQFPRTLHGEFGKYITGYCVQQEIPTRAQGVADRHYGQENAYHTEVIHRLLLPWLHRRFGQQHLKILGNESH